MRDVVEELRERIYDSGIGGVLERAADEIERLRGEVESWKALVAQYEHQTIKAE